MSKTIVVVAIFLVILGIYKITHMRWYGSGPNRISALGYQVEIHKVTTDDGYILELHRIPHPKKYEGGIMKRPVVLFVHGVYSTTDTFLLNGQENSLGFQAANEGFDVWLVNLRGNHYSSNHLNLSTLTMKYWDFSFHEMAVFDIPSTIDYILKKTGQKSLHYVGHSLGSLVFFVFLSEKPEYNIKLKTGHLLSAGINPEETRIGRVLGGRIGMFVMKLFDHGAIGVHFYLPPLNYSLWLICQTPLINNICLLALKLIGGPTTTINMNALPEIFTSLPTSTSARCVLHGVQGTFDFRQMNFGEKENMKRYGSPQPPPYNVTNVGVPTFIHYGGQDNLVTPSSVASLTDKMRDGVLKKLIFHEQFNHFDFLVSKDSRERVNNVIFDEIRKCEAIKSFNF